MGQVIDLRSDTVTLPPPEMREAMARAEVGDDVYGEDPSVNRLERRAADLLGKEAAIFVPSGTMANLLVLLVHCPRGRMVLLGDQSDLWLWEAGGPSVLGGLVLQPVATSAWGELDLADLEVPFHGADDPQRAEPGLICLESTHCMSGGWPLSLDYLARVRSFAAERGVPVHLDGARLFNAAVAQGVDPARIAAYADSVAFCLSKGLAAPVGSVVAGRTELIHRVRRLRKMVGGGMRQAGFLAAAGLYALERMVARLTEDHATARLLAQGLQSVDGLELETPSPPTNIVFWRLVDPRWDLSAFVAELAAEGLRVLELGRGRIRAVTHYGIGPEEVELSVEAVRRVAGRRRAGRSGPEVGEAAGSRGYPATSGDRQA